MKTPDDNQKKSEKTAAFLARLPPQTRLALNLFMKANKLENADEVLQDSLGHLLEREGYLIKDLDGSYRVADVKGPDGEYKVVKPE
jgi:hypothetical protein